MSEETQKDSTCKPTNKLTGHSRVGATWRMCQQLLNGLNDKFRDRIVAANTALKRPPQWQNIAELEASWSITDNNRQMTIIALKRFAVGVCALLLLALVAVFSMQTNSIWVLVTGMVIGLMTVVTLLILLSTSIWRIQVLQSREPLNYVDWLLGRRS